VTNPAAETKSIGLPADAQAVMVFASPPRQLYHDEKTPVRLPGLITLTTLSGRENFRPSTGTVQKRMPALIQTATSHTTGPSDCLITKIKSPRIDYLKFFVYRYPNKRLYKIGY
jgi:hypothetical protein